MNLHRAALPGVTDFHGQTELLRQVGLQRAGVGILVHGFTLGRAPERKSMDKDPDTRALEADLSEQLGLTVEIRHTGERGAVQIHFSNLEQLDEVCRRLTANVSSGAY